MDLLSLPSVLLTEVLWNVAVWIPTILLSLLFIRLVLGVRVRELVVEVEEHQTAAIGAVFFWVSLGFSLLLSRTIADPPAPTTVSWGEAFGWFGVALVITLLLFAVGVFAVFGTLARRRGEGLTRYLRREMRDEHNLALSFILGALFIVPVIVTYHITL